MIPAARRVNVTAAIRAGRARLRSDGVRARSRLHPAKTRQRVSLPPGDDIRNVAVSSGQRVGDDPQQVITQDRRGGLWLVGVPINPRFGDGV